MEPQKIYYTIYLTINKCNGRFYIGKHITKNLSDGYLGSGLLLRQAIKKHGKNNFFRQIIEIYPSEKEMDNRERKIINVEYLKEWEGITYNIALGGYGGNYINAPFMLPSDDPKYIKWYKKFISKCPQLKAKESKEYLEWHKSNENNPSFKGKTSAEFVDWKKKQQLHNPSSLPKTDPRYIEWKKKIKTVCPSFLPKDDPKFIEWRQGMKESNPANLAKDTPEFLDWKSKMISSNVSLLPKTDLRYIEWKEKMDKINSQKKGKIYIINTQTKHIKLISPDELTSFVAKGWIKGRRVINS